MRQTELAKDTAARATALTALDRTLLVEAGAGSGKTSVLAGRVAALLAAGRKPREIAAITFTELAASELRARVVAFVAELAAGTVRPDLVAGFGPAGPTKVQRRHLVAARDGLDELTCTTIHGFCQALLRPYPAEAGMDPGAAVMDREGADGLRDEVLEDWLRERLSGPARPGDVLAALFVHDAAGTGMLVHDVLRWMAHHRGAPVRELKRPDLLKPLRHAAGKLRAFVDTAECIEEGTAAIADELDVLMATAPAGDAAEVEALLHALAMPPPASCATGKGLWGAYRRKGKWQAALKAKGSRTKAEVLNDAATACYTACKLAHEAAQSHAAGRILHLVAQELCTVLTGFAERKRGAALVDFDDLLSGARDLLADRPEVRNALAARYTAVLVDEFQDTDPLQCEILWRLCAAGPDAATPWQEWPLRPGALFLVGDPKQAIYRFRGADVSSYVAVRARLAHADPASCLTIGQNFRSVAPILDWVNERFEDVLSVENNQPGFSRLFTTTLVTAGHPAIATLPIEALPGGDGLRDAEAEAVAAFCARVIGALPVRGRDGPRPCRPDDIALLAPSGTELWRYERALEAAGIAVSTQAGKGFFRRQEVQDLLALTRVLADGRDTLALGALLRGPLVGLTEEALLDATAALPQPEDGRPAFLRLWTPLDDVAEPLLRETLAILQVLAQSARGTTPFVLLSQAAEELQVRPLLRHRHDRTAERALANLDQFLEAARAYDTRGLLAFARAMTAQWKDAQRTMEGRPDTEQQSVSLVTMHASKGLEWPVVVPINMGGRPGGSVEAALDTGGRLHLRVFGHAGPGCSDALDAEKRERERERHRLWYVAATRARDLLLLPSFAGGPPKGSWQDCIGLDHAGLDTFDPAALGEGRLHRTEEPANIQDRAGFEAQAVMIAAHTRRIRRVTPHLAEAGAQIVQAAIRMAHTRAKKGLGCAPGSDDAIKELSSQEPADWVKELDFLLMADDGSRPLTQAFITVRSLLSWSQGREDFYLPDVIMSQLPSELWQVLAFCALTGDCDDTNNQAEIVRFAMAWHLAVTNQERAARVCFCELVTLEHKAFPGRTMFQELTKNFAHPIPAPGELDCFFKTTWGGHWLNYNERFKEKTPHRDFAGIWWFGRKMLPWLQRDYVRIRFKDYKPLSDQEDDVPYDWDHICPQASWKPDGRSVEARIMGFKDKNDRDAKMGDPGMIGNSLGNFRLVDYPQNRSAGDKHIFEKMPFFDKPDEKPDLGSPKDFQMANDAEEKLWRQVDVGDLKWGDSESGDSRLKAFQEVVELRTARLYNEFYDKLDFKKWTDDSSKPADPTQPSS